MTAKEQKHYDRQIDGIADSLLIKAHNEAFEITENVFLDIILRLRTKCDEVIRRKQERNKQNSK